MRDAVRDAFYDFNRVFEGDIPYLYQDVLGLVSVGVGILCDPVELAYHLPFVRADGSPASRTEIILEWRKIKALGAGDYKSGNPAAKNGHLYARPHTSLRLTEEGLRSTLLGKLNQNVAYLRNRFPEWDSWPADAQLGVLSLAWGCGPAFRFPKCEAALRAKDFRTAAAECRMVANGVELYGLKPRNKANRILLTNAAVAMGRLDPDVLYYPAELDAAPVDLDAETQPYPVAPVADFDIVHPDVPMIRPPPPDDEPPPAAA
jgi:hypothetical protein